MSRTPKPKGMGRIAAEDPKDLAHLMRAHLRQGPLPAAKFWPTGKTKDQGTTSCCVGYAWWAFLEASPLRTLTGPNGKQIYREAIKVDEWTVNDNDGTALRYGTSVRAGAKVLQARGHLSEYLWAFNAAEVKRFILTRGGVVAGFNWYEGCAETDRNGFIQLTGGILSGHATYLNGFSKARNAFRGLNSWGEGWGQAGRFWLRYEDMERLMAEDGEACSALEVAVAQ